MSSIFDIEDEHRYNGGEQSAQEVCYVKGGNVLLLSWCPLPTG
jgi:hypothetical protein